MAEQKSSRSARGPSLILITMAGSALASLVAMAEPPAQSSPPTMPAPQAIDPNGLADGKHALFIDQNNPRCSNDHDRQTVLDPKTPWCSPAALFEYRPRQKVHPGDTVYIRRGDYAITDETAGSKNYYHVGIATPGTVDARITLRSYPGEDVTIRGGSRSYKSIFSFNRTDYWTIDGLRFVGHVDSPAGRLYIPRILAFGQCRGLEIKNSSFLYIQGNDDIGYGRRWPNHPGREGWGGAVSLQTVESARIENVTIACVEVPDKIRGRISKLNADGLLCDNCTKMVVTGCRFLDCGHVSLYLRNCSDCIVEKSRFNNRLHTSLGVGTITANRGITRNHIVRGNIFHGTNEFPSESTLRGGAIQLGPGGMSDVLICNNVIYDGHNDCTAIGIINNLVQDPASAPISNIRIFNNTLYRAGLRGVNISNIVNRGRNAVDHVMVYNNIIAETRAGDALTKTAIKYDLTINLYDFVRNKGYGSEFKNNLVYTFINRGKIAMIRSPDGKQIVAYSTDQLNATEFAENNLSANPLFVDPAGGDFRLRAGSPALNAGLCLPEVPTDFNGEPRSRGGPCAIGALDD